MTFADYRNNLLPSDRKLFDELFEFSVSKAVDTLLDADVDDCVIQRVITAHWGILEEDFRHLLVSSKKNVAVSRIEQHLRFNGYSLIEAKNYISTHSIKIRLNHEHDLLSHWKNPEKILKTIQQEKKNKEK